MSPAKLNILHWHLRRLFRNVGWEGGAGVAVLIAVVYVYAAMLLPLQREVDDLRGEAERLRGSAAARRVMRVAHEPAGQLEQFYGFFRDKAGMEDALRQLYSAAEAEKVTLEQGDYQLASEHDGRLMRYDIALPVKGSYPQLRRFIARSLKDIPSLALDSVSFSRQAISDVNVEAQLRMTLYLPTE